DAKDGFESTPIHDAVLSVNHLTLDQALRQEPTSLNQHDGTGFTPLHWAVLRDDVDSISTLLAWKTDVDCRDIEGNTPLHIACRSTKLQAVRLLLAAKCSVSLPNDFSSTPLHATHMIRKLQILIRAGTDINSRDYRLRAPVHWASRVAWVCPYFSILRDAGADLSVVDTNGQSILH
ncbi:ankyrin repeat-containing domain protein, partial [Lasiosphaeria ovina]